MDETGGNAPIPDYGLRVAGFLITVAGVLLAGVGAIREWVEVAVNNSDLELLRTHWLGTELWQGKVVLALALVALIAVLITRMGATAGIRKAGAAVVVTASLATTAIAGATLALGTSGYVDDEIARAAALGVSQAVQDALRSTLIGTFHIGVWLTFAGGIVMLAGSTLTLAWAMRPRPEWDEALTTAGE